MNERPSVKTELNGLNIRRAVPADAAVLTVLGAATFTDTFGHLYDPKDLNAYLDEGHSREYYDALLTDQECAVWVAEGDNKAITGYCAAGPCSLPVNDMPLNSGELYRLYLEQSQQGTGLGRAFMDIVLAWLEANFEHLYVGVYAENVRAQKLYQRYGFEKVQDYIFMVGEYPDPEWIMKRGGVSIEKSAI
ncbi:GNAT family N-acetyltransferase [Hyphococcus lacteus]|uniref:GNAT family N-acetyltransferase n=1 Tax=Hyphococcus lacteus TaxID=3143536 RepID=A0ABV3YZR6_9PROT